MKKVLAGLLAVLFQFTITHAASAHSIPLTANPAQGAVLSQSPGRVDVMFSLELESGKSLLRVFDQSGKQVDLGKGGVDLNDAQHQRMTVTLPDNLPAGVYTVTWRVTSTAEEHVGHITEGEYAFVIGAGTSTSDPSAPYAWRYIGEDSSAPSASEPAGSQTGLFAILGGVVVIAAGVTGGFWFIRRHNRGTAGE